jgi:hypothetical protein
MSQRTAEQQRFDAAVEAALAPIVKRIEGNVEALASALAVANARIAHLERRVDALVGDLQ